MTFVFVAISLTAEGALPAANAIWAFLNGERAAGRGEGDLMRSLEAGEHHDAIVAMDERIAPSDRCKRDLAVPSGMPSVSATCASGISR